MYCKYPVTNMDFSNKFTMLAFPHLLFFCDTWDFFDLSMRAYIDIGSILIKIMKTSVMTCIIRDAVIFVLLYHSAFLYLHFFPPLNIYHDVTLDNVMHIDVFHACIIGMFPIYV